VRKVVVGERARLEVEVDRILLEEFKEVAKTRYKGRGWLRNAVEDALRLYIRLMR